MAKTKETKEQARVRAFNNYKNNYWAIPDYESYKASCIQESDKKLFTATTFVTYFYKQIPKESKDLIKAFKNNEIKKGNLVIDSLKAFHNIIKGQRWGCRKIDEVIMEFGKDFELKENKKINNKKTGIAMIKDFNLDCKIWGKKHFFFSNEYGNHVRGTDCYLNQFVETAKLRKTYELKEC